MKLRSFLFITYFIYIILFYPAVDAPIIVSNSEALKAALLAAAPGTCITMKRGYYVGEFVAHGIGLPNAFIRLEGEGSGDDVILTYRETAPVLTFKNTAYWIVSRFVVEGGDSSIKVDGARFMQFDSILVHHSASHGWLITHSSNNMFRRLQIYNTGRKYSHIGAGVRIGTPWHEGSDNCSDNTFIHLKIGPGIKAPGFEMLEGSKNSLLTKSYFDQIPHFLHFRGNNWEVSDCSMRTLRSKESADSVTFDSVMSFGSGNVLKDSTIDVSGASAADYGAFLYKPAKNKNRVCSSNKFIGYKKAKANKSLDGC